jgi:hypothetical protein
MVSGTCDGQSMRPTGVMQSLRRHTRGGAGVALDFFGMVDLRDTNTVLIIIEPLVLPQSSTWAGWRCLKSAPKDLRGDFPVRSALMPAETSHRRDRGLQWRQTPERMLGFLPWQFQPA